ncbi:MAG: F0F1 ATP synthase subunit alpha, partial [Chloroflexota bacterium]|nr:F0F1 ATP synthase subunit alpha [Chloroflexota bacterium]
MSIAAQEITALLKREIAEYDQPTTTVDVGTVTEVGDGIARVFGLAGVRSSELVEFESGMLGIALNLEEESVGVVILGEYTGIEEGQEVRSTGRIVDVPVGEALIGRVVNAIGEPIDGKGPIRTEKRREIERVAPGVITRKSVDTPLQTGIKVVDALTAIGRGQRELIIGDRQVGKSAIAVDTIINQKGQDVVCIYVAIGQKSSKVAQL